MLFSVRRVSYRSVMLEKSIAAAGKTKFTKKSEKKSYLV